MTKSYRVHRENGKYPGRVRADSEEKALSAAYVVYSDKIGVAETLSVFPSF